MTAEDSELYRQIRNMDGKRKWFKNRNIIEPQMQQKWYETYVKTAGEYMFSVYIKDNVFVGGVSIYNVDEERKEAEFGRLLLDTENNGCRGYGTIVTRAIIEMANRFLKLKKLYLEVYSHNIAAYKTYLKAGFQVIANKYDSEGQEMYFMEKEL